jgi:large subunit ribosomal protein L33
MITARPGIPPGAQAFQRRRIVTEMETIPLRIDEVPRTTEQSAGRMLMARSEQRPVVKLRSTAGTGYVYVTRKNRRNDPDRLVLRKYDPVARKSVEFREER